MPWWNVLGKLIYCQNINICIAFEVCNSLSVAVCIAPV